MKRIYGLALGVCLVAPFAVTAQPREGVYIGEGVGLNYHQDAAVEGSGARGDVEFELGTAFVVAVGYAFGGPRVEGELSYRSNNTDEGTLVTGVAPGTTSRLNGSFRTIAGMANFLYDIETGTEFTPYLGAGIGGAFAKYDSTGEDVVFAHQVIAGVSLNFGDDLEGFFDYRYMGTTKIEDTINTPLEVENRNHTALIGVRYYFAPTTYNTSAPVSYNPPPPAPAPLPIMRPVAPPPLLAFRAPSSQVAAALAMRSPAERRFLVFFDFDSSRVQNDGAQIIRDAAEAFRLVSVTRIDVTGHADRAGSRPYNQRLSRRRANAVKRNLISNGVPEKDIIIYARGERDNLVPTRDGVRQRPNRRVEIVLN